MAYNVEVLGVNALINRLSKFDNDVYKTLTKEVREGLKHISDHARANTPSTALSKWGPWLLTTGSTAQVGSISMVTGTRDLSFDGSLVRRNIRPRAVKRSQRGQVSSFKGQVVTSSAAGAIFSLAGSRNTGEPFNRVLNSKHGTTWPRTLTDARNAEGPRAAAAITAAIQKAAKAVENGRG